jgi:hypothetical protein
VFLTEGGPISKVGVISDGKKGPYARWAKCLAEGGPIHNVG